jgi:hypothetical protein
MRVAYSKQGRLDCPSVLQVQLNFNCRDEIIPILRALQHIYSEPELCDEILTLVARDVNAHTRDDRGREGMQYWQILVLAAVRLGCNLNYDKLQDLAEQHRALRHVMGIGDWEEDDSFNWRCIRDNVCLLQPATIERISQLIVAAGYRLAPEAAKKVRADSFVVGTNIHHPTESSLMADGVRVILAICKELSCLFGLDGWRQHAHLLDKVQRLTRNIGRISARKGPNYQKRLKKHYRQLIRRTRTVLHRARKLREELALRNPSEGLRRQMAQLEAFIERTEQVCNTADRRVLQGEKVPNGDKLFSIFEPHTQLYKRGKAGQPIQYGRSVIVYEDTAGFVVHHHVMPRDAQDQEVVVQQTQQVQEHLGGRIEELSLDRGFHSPENQTKLAAIIARPCLPKPGVKQAKEQVAKASVQFRQARQRHPGIESAIGALQSGNGLERCRDRTELGFERYVALGVLGRNLHTLGKLLIACASPDAKAAISHRKHVA